MGKTGDGYIGIVPLSPSASLKDPRHRIGSHRHGKEESRIEEETRREESHQESRAEEAGEEESGAQARRRQTAAFAQEDRAARPRAPHAALQTAAAGATRLRAAAQLAGGNGEEDEHGPMHIPSHKPVPAYAEMHKNDWAGKPPQHNIPIPKR